mgnify:CR=1 FL=1
MTYEMICTARDGDVLTITLNRPERLNAAPPQMFDEIGNVLDNLEGARAVLFHGEGRAFCSGADLQGRGSGITGPYEALTEHYNPTMLKLSRLPVPIVSAVYGPAAGIGCSLALAADFCLADESGYFLQAFVNIGLVPDGGATWTFTTYGREPAVEVTVPPEVTRDSSTAFLVDLAPAVNKSPQLRSCV